MLQGPCAPRAWCLYHVGISAQRVFACMQVVDWSEGGRTEVAHVKRIFSKEQPSGPHQVAAFMRRSVSQSVNQPDGQLC